MSHAIPWNSATFRPAREALLQSPRANKAPNSAGSSDTPGARGEAALPPRDTLRCLGTFVVSRLAWVLLTSSGWRPGCWTYCKCGGPVTGNGPACRAAEPRVRSPPHTGSPAATVTTVWPPQVSSLGPAGVWSVHLGVFGALCNCEPTPAWSTAQSVVQMGAG